MEHIRPRLFFYKAFGMHIRSEMELNELIECEPTNTVDIDIGLQPISEPSQGMKSTVYRPNVIFNPEFFYLHKPGTARYYVRRHQNRTKIDIDFYNVEDKNTMLSWLYGSVITAALQLNNRFAIHASGVLVNDSLHIFCGKSGMGKSTLAAQLKTRGYPVFTDDKCVLRWDEQTGSFIATPSIRIMRLWKDATDQLTETTFLTNPQTVSGRLEKSQYILDTKDIISEEKPIAACYIIRNVKKEGQLGLWQISGLRKVKNLFDQTHRFQYIKGLGKQVDHWSFLEKLANRIRMYSFLRPKDIAVEKFVDFVEKTINESHPSTINE